MLRKELIFFSYVPFRLKPCQNLFLRLFTLVDNLLRLSKTRKKQHQPAFQRFV